MGQPTVISTFAGGGGSSLGYKLAGYEELLAIDFDQNAMKTFQLNFPDVAIWQRDITSVTGQEILGFCGIKQGDLDVLDGSPPCQGFSLSGRRVVSDERNSLYMAYLRLIKELQPKVFIMENVSGMVQGIMKGMFLEITRSLLETGYTVKCKKMNAALHGVPQARERLIWIGNRSDLRKVPTYPEPLNSILSVQDVLPHLQAFTAGQFDRKIISVDNPCCTITKSPSMRVYENGIEREPTLDELKKLCSYPDDFQFVGSKHQAWQRMGNSVPPKLMERIARHVRKEILEK